MRHEPKVFMNQYPIVESFIYHIVYYRVLNTAYVSHKIQCHFWRLTANAHLLRAAILWCMVFGADGPNHVHWKRLSKQDSDALKTSFRSGLLRRLDMDKSQWELYWKEMTDFRNKYAAHLDLNYNNPVPRFDIALKVVYCYDDWVRKVIAPVVNNEPLLRAKTKKIETEITPLIERLSDATKEYQKHTASSAAKNSGAQFSIVC